MIIDNIKNKDKYLSVHPEFAKVFDVLAMLTGNCDKLSIDGEKAFVGASTYTTKPWYECKFEAHRKYIDIQFVVKGSEDIYLCDADSIKVKEDFQPGGDIAFYADCEEYNTAHLNAGDFVIIFPGEAHMPCVAPDENCAEVTKAVAKILL